MPKVKTVLVGDAGVGKTCIAERICHNDFKTNSYATVGAANLAVTIQTEQGPITFNIWDTAGQEKYRSLAPMYFTGAHLAILVFDITSKDSFNTLSQFVDLLSQRAPDDCVYVLVGNKCDLEEQRQVTEEEAEDYKQQIGAEMYMETSALSGKNIKELFEQVAVHGGLHFEDDQVDYLAETNEASGDGNGKKACQC